MVSALSQQLEYEKNRVKINIYIKSEAMILK